MTAASCRGEYAQSNSFFPLSLLLYKLTKFNRRLKKNKERGREREREREKRERGGGGEREKEREREREREGGGEDV